MSDWLDAIKWDALGLVPAIAQDAASGELEEHHDGEQRDEQRIVADVGPYEPHDVRTGRGHSGVCHLIAPKTS